MSAPQLVRVESGMIPIPAENIDTDQIVPARFLKVVDKAGLADALFHDWRFTAEGERRLPPFAIDEPRHAGRSVIVAGDNFGCGSSREHAPWALVAFGIRAVISTSFADIFRSNALKNGLLPIVVSADVHAQLLAAAQGEREARIVVDVASATIRLDDGAPVPFPIDAFSQKALLGGLDEIDYIRTFEREILAHERGQAGTIDTRAGATT
ncbi:MAG: 3-isopropylmalate dehydratase small subunit [Chloroflexota bacterium]|jgi:3-isopropylmalate/(R)-2-methylmalate dehydratase small subunit